MRLPLPPFMSLPAILRPSHRLLASPPSFTSLTPFISSSSYPLNSLRHSLPPLLYSTSSSSLLSSSSSISSSSSSSSSRSLAQADWLLRFDGASKGNPGIASCGAVLYLRDGKEGRDREVWASSVFFGSTLFTNNVAEYRGLAMAARLRLRNLRVEGDSQLILRQMTGEYQVKHPNLQPLHQAAKLLEEKLRDKGKGRVSFTHIPRESNCRADELCNQAIEERTTRTTLLGKTLAKPNLLAVLEELVEKGKGKDKLVKFLHSKLTKAETKKKSKPASPSLPTSTRATKTTTDDKPASPSPSSVSTRRKRKDRSTDAIV